MKYKLLHKIFVNQPLILNQWSSSKLAKIIRNFFNVTEQPNSASLSEWRKWEKANRNNIGYIIAEHWLDNIQCFVLYPKTVISNIKHLFKMTFIEQHHLINTGLEKGEYHENDTRMLHGMFNILVDYVEVELAHMMMLQLDPAIKLNSSTRNREAGLKHLDWEILNTSTEQSQSASDIKELYLWWVDIRPNRPAAADVSGWKNFCELREFGEDMGEEERSLAQTLLTQYNDINTQYSNEDTEMMIRLIKLRSHLWT